MAAGWVEWRAVRWRLLAKLIVLRAAMVMLARVLVGLVVAVVARMPSFDTFALRSSYRTDTCSKL